MGIHSSHNAAAEAFKDNITIDNLSAKMTEAEALDSQYLTYYIITFVIMFIICLVLYVIPLWAAQVRRLHDVGKSGHLLWLWLVCLIGGLIPFFMCISDGRPEPNQYGESPKFKEE